MADILTNPKARRDYHIVETFEAGLVLKGTEVKALRAGRGQISDAFARVDHDEELPRNLRERSGKHICIRCLKETEAEEWFANDFVCDACAEIIEEALKNDE